MGVWGQILKIGHFGLKCLQPTKVLAYFMVFMGFLILNYGYIMGIFGHNLQIMGTLWVKLEL